MKKHVLTICLSFSLLSNSAQAIMNSSENNDYPKIPVSTLVPTLVLPSVNMSEIIAEDLLRDKQGKMYRIGVARFTDKTFSNSGFWTELENGSRVWRLNVKSSGAEALTFIFDKFIMAPGAKFWVENKNLGIKSYIFDLESMLESQQQIIDLIFGDEMILTFFEPLNVKGQSEILLSNVFHGYRSTGNPYISKINESDACQVNSDCPNAADYTDESRGVARILVTDSGSQGYCSGSLVNNTSQNCKPYFLTAFHCGQTATVANFNLWKFYFKYEVVGCVNPTVVTGLSSTAKTINGCVNLSNSADGGGATGSDFLCLQLGTLANEATTITKLKNPIINAYWNGWDANNVTTNVGASIHHPAGDIKKISFFKTNLLSTTWGGSLANSHWRVTWAPYVTGTSTWGVTEGGSSGSPIFAFNGGNSRIMGTLTGGGSFCNQLTSPDAYGKVFMHWTQNGATPDRQLKSVLDPGNTGLTVLNGSGNPCSLASLDDLTNKQFSIYPNPAEDMLTIDLAEVEGTVTLEILNVMGQVVSTQTQINPTKVDLNIQHLAKGTYILKVKTNKGTSVQNFVKN